MMRYEKAIDWLYGTQLFGIKLGLENTERLLREWRLPAEGQRLIHVAGTNGKGSVCAMVDSICRAGGYRTGLFTSPHLVSYRERIRVNFEMIGEREAARLLSELRELVTGWKSHPTFFELTTVLAMRYFAEQECEVVVLETGMGGRLDATTGVIARAVSAGLGGGSSVSVVTRIGMDHEQWLGDTIEKISHEKAGIMREGVPVVSARQAEEAELILEARAEEVGTEIEFIDDIYARGALGLSGRHQRENAALARAAIGRSGLVLSDGVVDEGLANVRWRGRFERVGARLVLDGAHNPEATRALVETWREEFGDERAIVFFGAVESKDVGGMVSSLAEIASVFHVVTVGTARGIEAEALVEVMRGLTEVPCVVGQDLEEAFVPAEETLVLVTGSLFLVGECLGMLEGREFERSLQ